MEQKIQFLLFQYSLGEEEIQFSGQPKYQDLNLTTNISRTSLNLKNLRMLLKFSRSIESTLLL